LAKTEEAWRGRRREERARGKQRGETYLSTGMVNVGCTMAAIVESFDRCVPEAGACQKVMPSELPSGTLA
jgi:hypothetical protein